MDWCLSAQDPEALRAMRGELATYLQRHGKEGADVAGALTAAAEVLGNAVEHGEGPYVWISVDWSRESPVLTVHDLGEGFTPDVSLPDDVWAESGRGLFLADHHTDDLKVAAKRAGGSRVSMTLPVPRRTAVSRVPPRREPDSLPHPQEASEDGTFAREPFLRALVVELSRAVERMEGPEEAEAVVTQVGTNIGGRIEEEYRRARGLVERLGPDRVAALCVELKAAIEGDFYIIAVDDDRIVLGNRACPFGDDVRRSPALCRMTSSVFGGIGARNTGAALVQLEERIAVGDPECRVNVWLGAAAEAGERPGHLYRDSANEGRP
jgi:anti-sigma regulatory factor (Ser/Thr protein kinase)/predicted ArsR family transcriptional regulator